MSEPTKSGQLPHGCRGRACCNKADSWMELGLPCGIGRHIRRLYSLLGQHARRAQPHYRLVCRRLLSMAACCAA